MNTYYHNAERNFANEYSVGIARNAAEAADFVAAGWERVTRKSAIKLARYRGDDATQAFVSLYVGRTDVSVSFRDEFFAAIKG